MKPVIFILGQSALPLAQRLKAELDGEIHAPKSISDVDINYEKASTHLVAIHSERRIIVGLCASGILIRSLGPHLSDKRSEMPVIAVAEDGSAVVPLLGGHNSGNLWAKRISEFTKGFAAIGLHLRKPRKYEICNDRFAGWSQSRIPFSRRRSGPRITN
jgi:cobalt-precorrin 5A hydrolase / precorrin-3B C17-methyltransferase